jgi:hypothetical protein
MPLTKPTRVKPDTLIKWRIRWGEPKAEVIDSNTATIDNASSQEATLSPANANV